MQLDTIFQKSIKHLALLSKLGPHDWTRLITIQCHSSEDYTLHIQPTSAIMAKLPNGDKPGPKSSLRTSIDTLKATLLLPATMKIKKLPNDTTPLLTTIHNSWLQYIQPSKSSPMQA
jgi:hypothetical protein